jgi:acetyl-CoA acetyltransferase
MCAPSGDGAAALVLVSAKAAARLGLRPKVRVLSSVLASEVPLKSRRAAVASSHAALINIGKSACGLTCRFCGPQNEKSCPLLGAK